MGDPVRSHRLYIMRHGPAEDWSASGRDAERALTPSGRDRVRDVAVALVANGERPSRLLSSPLLRARQTADIVAEVSSQGGTLEISGHLAPGGRLLDLVTSVLREGPEHGSATLFTGHEPDLSRLVARLVGRTPPQGIQKAMVVSVDLLLEQGGPNYIPSLRFVLEPETLTWQRG